MLFLTLMFLRDVLCTCSFSVTVLNSDLNDVQQIEVYNAYNKT